MPEFICSPKELVSSVTCADRGGWYLGFYTKFSAIDWETIIADNLLFNATTRTVIDFGALLGGNTWEKIEPKGEGATYAFNYTSDTQWYDCSVNFVFDGKEKVRTANIQSAILCCDFVLVLFCNNGTKRVVGASYNGDIIQRPTRNFRITQHNDDGGVLGGTASTDTMAMGGVQLFAPLYGDFTVSDFT